ncbi:putative guanine nucleotide exchange factor [Aspergillus nomiae NRRL 13137]|uniref:Putative guanine nucleotide exchange factor n=1 Tax=Aspergillus nomiae NRRL (strain ATCC 15546 / NRRL 13137 / CBS 260.88 / M93) TaxID=1509407 RepID=A0A0L1J6E5_ASPN3|nr:putative guanine nucleotide exchange factor [Aspergillus nomiae NRRL 13137]KNG87314.1 putative guanine nucleotide exchange factor [Aspergillus nomiae NRRL 13137]
MEPNLTRVESPGGKPGHAPGKSITALLERNFGSNTQSTPEDKNAICTLRRAHTVAQGKNVGEKSKVGSKTARERIATSFLRVKDSHELLRKRSSKRLDTPASPRDTPAAAREANHFTVGNVGQNGKIFLRPIRNQSLKEPRPQPFASSVGQSKGDHVHSRGLDGHGVDEPSRWSNSQLSELRPELIPEETCDDRKSIKTESTRSGPYRSLHHPRPRARSFSTISEQGSTFRAGANGEFRIFIDRSDDRPKSADGSLRPTLGTSIPHYGWDFSHYGADGSTPLYNSIYSRASLSDNCLAARFLRESLNTGPISDVYLSQPDRPSFAASMFSGTPAIELTRGSTATDKPILYELKEPIEPSIFENLVPEMDDDRVVRYVPRTKDISAATPARIVAQISSESFMDYELVSDFFLTFRSYLSASSLLALLLARLQWAINRPQDDGRIIRIRTFAALRHWILNYFVDDFIPDYDLRVRFCETINRMYDSVKAREGGGTSDLKILIDLKRCWYGRCSSYWDFQDQHIAYHTPDYLIVPGGDEQLATGCAESHLKMVRTTSGQDREGRPRPPHVRNDSSATAKSMPVSADSDQSIHATSCSLPPKSPKRLSMSVMDTKGPHLVALAPLKPVGSLQDPPTSSPVASRRFPFHSHAHKRSGSFSDSARDGRAPLSLLKLDSQGHLSTADTLNLGALIRGELYAPAESYMTMMAPPSPPLPFSSGTDRQSQPEETSKPAISSSGVKTIIGSIRRALNSRSGGQGTSTRNTHGHFAPSTRGKTSAMPTNVAFGSDYYRDRKAATAAKKPARIDILCDRSLQEYHRALTGYVDAKDDDPVQEAGTLRSKRSWVGPGVDVDELDHPALRPDQGRTKSVLTGGSKSIVIVDDTGFRNPLMSGAVGLEQPPGFLNGEHSPITPRAASFYPQSQRSTVAGDEYSLPIYFDDTDSRSLSRASQFLRPPGLFASQRSSSVGRGSTSWKRTSPSLRLRKYASFQSGISRQRLAVVAEPDIPSVDQDSPGNIEKPAGPTLRRRPGGDLRQMRDGWVVHYPHSQRLLCQDLRRSFEAAIAQFAQIPDDDDGGVESALMKLEGKWTGGPTDTAAEPQKNHQAQRSAREQEFYHTPHVRTGWDAGVHRRQTLASESSAYSHFRGRSVPRRPYSESLAESEDSYSSIPLLERGLSDESMKKPSQSRTNSHQAAPGRVQPSDASSKYTWYTESSHPSFDIVKETESIKRIPRGSTFPAPHGFSRRLSGLSENSANLLDSQEAADQRLSFYTDSMSRSSLGIPRHPLAHPPTPPMTIQHRSVTSCASPLNPALFQAPPLTPDPSPSRNIESAHVRAIDTQHVSGDVLSRSEWGRQYQDLEPDHVPFILSCESRNLAQQLTIIEMAALSEIDWKDLVDMRWSSGSPSSVSWVEFLMEEERRGIDLVVGRFNLMVKWILSEIVLTRDIHERARTIAKFIHTAAHARRMCNYATMLQIAIALSSTDCSRLQQTWALVPSEDRGLLKDMEVLIQPVRNFHDLRVEMETANVQGGCIPFVGLYVHDLTYNSQKPAQVAAHDGEPLINFERYRTTAKIVKSLLRLIDASTKYTFAPVQGIIERCLWIASLSEEEIQTHSKRLE